MGKVLRKDGIPDGGRKRKPERACAICGRGFEPINDYVGRVSKYCSKKCWSERGAYRRLTCAGCGKVGLGKHSKVYCSRACAFRSKIGNSAGAWKGEIAGYSAIHKWVTATFGKPQLCERCGTTGKRMHWANIDHKYRRNRADWIPMCARCHYAFDREHNGQT